MDEIDYLSEDDFEPAKELEEPENKHQSGFGLGIAFLILVEGAYEGYAQHEDLPQPVKESIENAGSAYRQRIQPQVDKLRDKYF